MEAAGKFLGLFVCLLVLLSFLEVLQLPPVYSPDVPQTPPTIQDFWINSTWSNQTSQFAFSVTDSWQLYNATLQTNVTGSNVNSTIGISGTAAWANFTVTLPDFNGYVVAYQFWVCNTNSTIYATTGAETMLCYLYNSTAGAWNTPYEYLGQAISSIENANTWGSNTDIYAQVILNHMPQSSLRSLIDNYGNSQDWIDVLKWSAFCNKLNITQYSDVQTDIQYALGNYTMVGSLPCTGLQYAGENSFTTEYKWGLYGFYFNAQSWMGSYQNDTRWNVTAAYDQYDQAVNFSVARGGLPLWVFADGTGRTFSNRYYDEDACTIECYLLFDELLNVPDGMNKALYWWNYLTVTHWNSAQGFFQYQPANPIYECEAPFFLEIITELKYYYPVLGNWTNVLTDIGNRFLSNEWSSTQWTDGSTFNSAYAVVHSYSSQGGVSNTERRTQNTIATWQALLGVYLNLNATYQSNMDDMLTGNSNTQPAWALLLTPDPASNNAADTTYGISGTGAGLFNSTAQMFSWNSADNNYQFSNDKSATAWGEILLFMLGIVPQTTTTAFPIEELNYEYLDNIDPLLLAFNLNKTARQVSVPVDGAGTLEFQYGVSPVTYNFTSAGVWQVSFSPSWNMITSVTYVSALPTNLIYFSQAVPPLTPSVNISPTPVTLDIGQSQLFTSSVSGGTPPYTYQWYLNGSAVQDATSNSWTFTPTSAGSYTIYTNVTDSVGAQATSNDATVTVNPGTHDIAVTNATPYQTATGQGLWNNITVTIANLGGYSETFNVTVYANATVIATITNINLASGSSLNQTILWNTTGFGYSNYTLSAYASPVAGETNTSNNNCAGGWVFVSLVGDLTGPNGVPDGKVDIRDVNYVARRYGTTPSSPNWDPNCDVTGSTPGVPDGKVDILDVHLVALYYGTHYP